MSNYKSKSGVFPIPKRNVINANLDLRDADEDKTVDEKIDESLDGLKYMALLTSDTVYDNTINNDYTFLLAFDFKKNLSKLFTLNDTVFNSFKSQKDVVIYVHIMIGFEWLQTSSYSVKNRVIFNVKNNNSIVHTFIIGVDGNMFIDKHFVISLKKNDELTFNIDRQIPNGLIIRKDASIIFENYS